MSSTMAATANTSGVCPICHRPGCPNYRFNLMLTKTVSPEELLCYGTDEESVGNIREQLTETVTPEEVESEADDAVSEVESEADDAVSEVESEADDAVSEVESEAGDAVNLPGTLERHMRERTPITSESAILENEPELKPERKAYLETLADVLVANRVQDKKVEQDGREELETENRDDVVMFLADASNDILNMIAHYLKKRKLSSVLLSPSNFHYVMHTSDSLGLQHLTSHCYEFLDENPQIHQRFLVQNCDPCKNIIALRKKISIYVTTMKAYASKLVSPHFCIAFSRGETKGANIAVIDITTGCEIYSRKTKRPFLCGRGFSCCAVHYSDCPYVFISGGKQKQSKQVWRYDIIVSEWKKMPSMIHGRSYHSMVAFNNQAIYVIGGTEVSCIEEFNLDSNKWEECTGLNSLVGSTACAVYKEKIYIFGDKDSVAEVQCFTPSSNTVETLNSLPSAVGEGHAVVFRGKIFIVTGQGQIVNFDPLTGSSCLGASQPVIRSEFCLFVKYNKIYISGGRLVGKGLKKDSENDYRYNISTDAWTRTQKLLRSLPVRTFCDVHIQRRCPVVPFKK